MKKEVKTLHVSLQYSNRKKAEIFFNKILGLKLNKTFTLSKDLSNQIFNIDEEVIVDVYSNDKAYFEVFITKIITKYNFEHICIEIDNKKEFIEICKSYGLKPIFVKKGEKTLLFIKDFSGYLFEIKESQS
ncbi:MAG: hypothetical protein AYK22_04155 [Thermoplasmatales archaeon SG8-52-3]|nr:MAG: hypothetical protein AYK22_04155 [Thermoplasmatales archaeon SG8-52-3]